MKRQTVSSPKTNTFEWIPICALVVHPDLAKLSPLDPDKVDYYRQAFLSEGINVAFPIRVVRKGPSTYQILNGRHRYFAACAAGINEVFCLITSESEKHITKRLIEDNLIGDRLTKETPERRILNTLYTKSYSPNFRNDLWSVARVNKNKWYAVLDRIKAPLALIKKKLPDLSESELLYKAMTEKGFCDPIYDLYHASPVIPPRNKRDESSCPSHPVDRLMQLRQTLGPCLRQLKRCVGAPELSTRLNDLHSSLLNDKIDTRLIDQVVHVIGLAAKILVHQANGTQEAEANLFEGSDMPTSHDEGRGQ